MKLSIILILFALLFHLTGCAQDTSIQLPEPTQTGGMPLMEALSLRKTSRVFSSQDLDLQTLSNLLWAANGLNRPTEGKRTAPSARNWQEIDIYVCLKQGVYVYNAHENRLDLHMQGDIREATGTQDYVKDAPVNLVFIADFTRMDADRPDDEKYWYAAADASFISQNVYLFCASEGLATVVRGSVDKDALKELMNLSEHQYIVLAQTVGYHGK